MAVQNRSMMIYIDTKDTNSVFAPTKQGVFVTLILPNEILAKYVMVQKIAISGLKVINERVYCSVSGAKSSLLNRRYAPICAEFVIPATIPTSTMYEFGPFNPTEIDDPTAPLGHILITLRTAEMLINVENVTLQISLMYMF